MYRAEPRTYVSRSTFLTVMRKAYGFRIAPLAGPVDHAALRTLNEVHPREGQHADMLPATVALSASVKTVYCSLTSKLLGI